MLPIVNLIIDADGNVTHQLHAGAYAMLGEVTDEQYGIVQYNVGNIMRMMARSLRGSTMSGAFRDPEEAFHDTREIIADVCIYFENEEDFVNDEFTLGCLFGTSVTAEMQKFDIFMNIADALEETGHNLTTEALMNDAPMIIEFFTAKE